MIMGLFRLLVILALVSYSTFPSADDRFRGQTLNFLIWSDYADLEVIKKFEDRYKVTVGFTHFETSEGHDKYLTELGTDGLT
jgi:spermidine/putrescine-binding protein